MVDAYAIVRRITGHELISPNDSRRLIDAVDGLIGEIAGKDARIAELAADNERLQADRDFWKERFQVETRARIAAFDSTGAVKVLPRPDTVSMSGGAICLEYADYDLRDAAYDWLEAHGAGVDLVAHPRATNTVDAHETANVSDKPEGQQEPVAWGGFYDGEIGGAWVTEAEAKDAAFWHKCELRPLYTRPSEQAVTEAMVEVAERTMAAHYERPLKAWELTSLHEALKAAMEAGG